MRATLIVVGILLTLVTLAWTAGIIIGAIFRRSFRRPND